MWLNTVSEANYQERQILCIVLNTSLDSVLLELNALKKVVSLDQHMCVFNQMLGTT